MTRWRRGAQRGHTRPPRDSPPSNVVTAANHTSPTGGAAARRGRRQSAAAAGQRGATATPPGASTLAATAAAGPGRRGARHTPGAPRLDQVPAAMARRGGAAAGATRRARPRLYPTQRAGHVASGRGGRRRRGRRKWGSQLAIPDLLISAMWRTQSQRRGDLSQPRLCAGRTSQWRAVLHVSDLCCHRLNIGMSAIRSSVRAASQPEGTGETSPRRG